jgi:hypothetical protein
MFKATHVPLSVEAPATGGALAKLGYVRQLDLQPGDVEKVSRHLADNPDAVPESGPGAADHPVLETLTAFEKPPLPAALPRAAEFKDVPIATLRAFGQALAEVRRHAALQRRDSADTSDETAAGVELARLNQTINANQRLAAHANPIGMLNLERLEMVPAGIERGELIATIPLAPLEQTAVTQKEWSVTSKEFTSIVTDSLESYSETGVTDNTELAQSSTSQAQHANQFNVTGTVSGGIPLISGSSTAGFTDQGSQSTSATDSRKHAATLTQKASSRARQEHKVTISTTSVSGTSQTTTRTLRNPSATDPIRIDYFSMMRKWRVRLYRYGLRLTYDLVVPEPGAALRRAHAELEELRGQLRPFEFLVPHSEITLANYQTLADRYGAQPPNPPRQLAPYVVSGILPNPAGHGINDFQLPLGIKAGHKVAKLSFSGGVTGLEGVHFEIAVVGSNFHRERQDDQVYDPTPLLDPAGRPFLLGATGDVNVAFYFHDCSSAIMQITVETEPSDEALAQWKSEVWNALYNAAQTQYYARQQDIAARITALEEALAAVDTLTLRREESDEVMKTVLRYLLGTGFEFMPDSVKRAFEAAGTDMKHGIEPDDDVFPLPPDQWSTLMRHEESVVKFINQAIEWESVVTFLYSYFWDIPDSWQFIRNIQHPDATRQAFLRAGSARVVLTVRKGWEDAWVQFVEGGGTPLDPDHPYLRIAQEIAAYDDRNYPGIPPANPGRTAARLEDSVYTTSAERVAANATGPVSIKVGSSAGFVAGLPVLIDSADTPGTQEAQILLAVPDPTHLVVQRLAHPHGGPGITFPIVQPGENGALIAEWNEYTPTSGTDIAVTSNLATIS